jgi:hypothetical protein
MGALALAVRFLPALPDPVAVLLVVMLGLVVALPDAWAAAVRGGHRLMVLAPEGRLRALFAGAGLRVALAGGLGVVVAVLLVLRLMAAGPVLWLLSALALPLTWAALAALAPRLSAEVAGLHALRLAHLWSRGLAVAVLVVTAGALGLAVPAVFPSAVPVATPLSGPPAGAPLVAEALVVARLWAGLEGYALGQAAEFGAWGRGLALAVGAAGLAGALWALTGLAVALTLSGADIRRALAPASDAAVTPPVGRAGPFALAGVMALALFAGVLGGARLAGVPWPERPGAQGLVAVEVIGEALHAAGTAERLAQLRAAAVAQDEGGGGALLARLRGQKQDAPRRPACHPRSRVRGDGGQCRGVPRPALLAVGRVRAHAALGLGRA